MICHSCLYTPWAYIAIPAASRLPNTCLWSSTRAFLAFSADTALPEAVDSAGTDSSSISRLPIWDWWDLRPRLRLGWYPPILLTAARGLFWEHLSASHFRLPETDMLKTTGALDFFLVFLCCCCCFVLFFSLSWMHVNVNANSVFNCILRLCEVCVRIPISTE